MTVLKMTDLDLQGKRVLIREDLNVPVKDGVVTSDARILASLPTVGQLVGVIGDDLGKTRIKDACESQLRRRRTDFATGKIVVNRQDGVLRIQQIMDHDLTKGRKRFAQSLCDSRHLLEQDFLFFCRLFHGNTIYTELDIRSIN